MSKLRNLTAPFAASLLGLLVSGPAHAVYLEADESTGGSISGLLARLFGQLVSFFAANNGGIVP